MYKKILLVVTLFVLLIGCDDAARLKERKDVEKQQNIYTTNQPPPFFQWSFERYLLDSVYRQRNEAVATYSIIISDFGKVLYETPSIGFPIPADTQLTNPLMLVSGTSAVIEQPEPNGLYTSKNTNATFIMSVDVNTGNVEPIYSEPKVICFPFPVSVDKDGQFHRISNGEANLIIPLPPQVQINHPAVKRKK